MPGTLAHRFRLADRVGYGGLRQSAELLGQDHERGAEDAKMLFLSSCLRV
jgi:hypothetical protein